MTRKRLKTHFSMTIPSFPRCFNIIMILCSIREMGSTELFGNDDAIARFASSAQETRRCRRNIHEYFTLKKMQEHNLSSVLDYVYTHTVCACTNTANVIVHADSLRFLSRSCAVGRKTKGEPRILLSDWWIISLEEDHSRALFALYIPQHTRRCSF